VSVEETVQEFRKLAETKLSGLFKPNTRIEGDVWLAAIFLLLLEEREARSFKLSGTGTVVDLQEPAQSEGAHFIRRRKSNEEKAKAIAEAMKSSEVTDALSEGERITETG